MPFEKGKSGNPNGRPKKSSTNDLQATESEQAIVPPCSEPGDDKGTNNNLPRPVSPISLTPVPRGPGRPRNAGASVREWANKLNEQNLSRAELLQIAADDTLPTPHQQAAIRLSRMNERPNLADFEDWLEGTKSLRRLQEEGLDTSLVRKAKVRHIPQKGGDPIIERELELHDRGLKEAEFVVSHTDGKATQKVEVTAPPSISLNITVPGLEFLPATLLRRLAPAPTEQGDSE